MLIRPLSVFFYFFLGVLFSGTGIAAQAKAPSPLEKAVHMLFPKAVSERATVFLDPATRARVAKLTGQPFERGMVFRYLIRDRQGKLLATAYLDRHKVRSKPETVLGVVGLDGRLIRIRVLAFAEPKEYLPREGWYRQFDGKALGPELGLRRGIDAVSGATLSSRACTRAARRMLAIHRVLSLLHEEKNKEHE